MDSIDDETQQFLHEARVAMTMARHNLPSELNHIFGLFEETTNVMLDIYKNYRSNPR